MQEKNLRKVHRDVGIIVAIFIIIQALSGALLSLQHLIGGIPFGQGAHQIIQLTHFRLGNAGDVYRILLGLGIIWMAVTGGWIYLKIRARTAQK